MARHQWGRDESDITRCKACKTLFNKERDEQECRDPSGEQYRRKQQERDDELARSIYDAY